VGWIIDADNEVAESDETNNTAYKIGYQLTVVPGPTPDIKVNGQDNSITVSAGTPVSLTIDLNAGGMHGMSGDLFIFVKHNHSTQYSWLFPCYWWVSSTPLVSAQFDLFSFANFQFLAGQLPKGHWDFTFAVDPGDGIYEGTFKDSIKVIVE